MKKFWLLAVLMLVFSFVGCKDEKVTTYYLPDVSVDDIFEITVRDVSDGGYLWNYEVSSASALVFIGTEYIRGTDDPEAVPFGGHYIYSFKAIKEGNYSIRFECKRPWEEVPIETIIYKIKIVKS